MILSCPECQKQFNVPAKKIGDKGRTVRCGRCKHTWHVEPEKQVKTEDLEKTDIDASLDKFKKEEGGVTPQPEETGSFQNILSKEMGGKASAAENKKSSKKKKALTQTPKNKLLSILIGVIVLLVLLLASIPFKSAITEMWPSSQNLYKAMGMNSKVIGQTLVFDRVEIRTVDNMIEVSGFVINLVSSTEEVPRVLLSISSSGEETKEIDIFNLPFLEIEGEASRPFRKSFELEQGLDASAGIAKLQFVP